ncbi:hypothetical protein CPB86DRAFT_871068 [Serendipita vermifera]|nr:hypothetical protein CPB86DRAFT_871068 [Serendipita vermifera]
MGRIRQLLQKRLAESALPQPEEKRPGPLPHLPVELWFVIIQMAIRPSLVVDLEFEPFEIEQAHIHIDGTSKTSEEAAQRVVSRNKQNLGAVCRSWKELVDSIDTLWAWDVTYSEGASPITDPYQCPRLNQHHSIPSGSQINSKYTHPVSYLSMDVTFHDYHHHGPIHMTSLKETISFPEHLRVLSLHIEQCRASKDALRDIEVMHIPLTTLGLRTNSVDILQTSLEIPTLVSLFMTIPEHNETSWDNPPSYFRWNFPSLRNFWWDVYRPAAAQYLPHGHPLFLEILRNHFESIRSLRINPIASEVANRYSSLCWVKMPNLQALATKFYRLDGSYHNYGVQSDFIVKVKSDSMLSLVVLDDLYVASLQNIVDALQNCMDVCTNLQAVYLTGDRPLYSKRPVLELLHPPKTTNLQGRGAMRRLQRLCKEKSIQLKYEKDGEFLELERVPLLRRK